RLSLPDRPFRCWSRRWGRRATCRPPLQRTSPPSRAVACRSRIRCSRPGSPGRSTPRPRRPFTAVWRSSPAIRRNAHTISHSASPFLADVESGIAVYRAGDALHLLRLSDGRDRIFRQVKGLTDAQLEPGGLFYAYNVPAGGAKPGRVTFVPFAQVAAALA